MKKSPINVRIENADNDLRIKKQEDRGTKKEEDVNKKVILIDTSGKKIIITKKKAL